MVVLLMTVPLLTEWMLMPATLFVHPMTLSRLQQMFLLLPLCLAVSVVYKATKIESLSHLPKVVLVNWLTIVVGMYAVGAALLLLHYAAS